MIPHSHFTRIADKQDVDAKTVERDYVLRTSSRRSADSRETSGSTPNGFSDMFEKRMPQWKTRWQTEMREHLAGEPQPFRTIERGVRRALRPRLRSN